MIIEARLTARAAQVGDARGVGRGCAAHCRLRPIQRTGEDENGGGNGAKRRGSIPDRQRTVVNCGVSAAFCLGAFSDISVVSCAELAGCRPADRHSGHHFL